MNSLRKKLLYWLVLLLTFAGTAGGIAAYYLARQEPDSFLDNQLRQIALFVGDKPAAEAWKGDSSFDPEEEIIVQVWPGAGGAFASSSAAAALPKSPHDGFSNVTAAGELWRSFTVTSGARSVQVAQRASVRNELAANSALRAVAPVLALIPLSWLAVGWVTRRVFRPLDQLAAQVGDRHAGMPEPLRTDAVPAEVLPFINAINALLARQHELLEARKRFTADAAHQLRTPLTALRLQVSNLARSQSRSQRAELMADMDSGLKRMSAMTAQLLKMARADQGADAENLSLNDVLEITEEVISGCAALAASRSIAIRMTGRTHAKVLSSREDLTTMIANIIDNAIRYTPPGGEIDVAVSSAGGAARIVVNDTGPGLSEADLPLVFERFTRFSDENAEGTGLGLAISRSIAERHGGTIELKNKSPAPGLTVTVSLAGIKPRPAEPRDLTKK